MSECDKKNEDSLFNDLLVVELATMVFAPSAAVILADFGAQVIKVEPTGKGDLNRELHGLPGMPQSEVPYTFQMDNRNKKSLAINLKSEQGISAFYKLLEKADVFVTNYRTQGLARLKLDYERVKAINPQIIYAAGTGYGEKGEEKDKPGYDSVCYFSRSGFETQVFPYDGWLPAFPFGGGDHPSGTSLFAAIMTGLYKRAVTGEGSKVTTSLLANGAWANATMLSGHLSGAKFYEKRPRAKAYNFMSLHYRSRDGRLLKLGMVNAEKHWAPFCELLSRSELADDPRFCNSQARAENMEQLIALIDDAFAEQDMEHWQCLLEQYDIPHSLMLTYPEAGDDPQKAANDIVIPLQHEKFGELRTINSPFQVSDSPKTTPVAAPEHGQHSREVLHSVGYDEKEIAALLAQGIVEQT